MALPLVTKAILALAVAGSVSYLVMADDGDGVLEYVFAEKVVASPTDYAGRTIKVHGTVVPGTIRQKIGSSGDYTFEIESEGSRLAIHFTSMVPDTFAEGGEVILTGQLSEDGTRFDSDEMAAKCPSKYEEEPMANR